MVQFQSGADLTMFLLNRKSDFSGFEKNIITEKYWTSRHISALLAKITADCILKLFSNF